MHVKLGLSERKQLASELARELADRDELTEVVLDVGVCGLQLWDSHVATSPGRHQRHQAIIAIQLYQKGYPCELLVTKEGLEDAKLYNSIPFGVGDIGFRLFGSMLKPFLVGVVSIVVVTFVAVLWRLGRLKRPKSGAVGRPRGLGILVRKLRERLRSAAQAQRSEVE